MSPTERFTGIIELLASGEPFSEEEGRVLLHEFHAELLREQIVPPKWPGSDVSVPVGFMYLLSDTLDTIDGYENPAFDE